MSAVTSTSSSFLAGLLSVTAADIGKKVGITLVANLMTEPVEFFISMGLSDLFGTSTTDELEKIFEKLEALEKEIEGAVGELSAVIHESELEEEHANISTHFGNLKTAILSGNDITSGY